MSHSPRGRKESGMTERLGVRYKITNSNAVLRMKGTVPAGHRPLATAVLSLPPSPRLDLSGVFMFVF